MNLEVPLWLIQPLLERRQQIVAADLPKVYTELYREIFKADATVVDMRKFNVYYYELGQYIKHLDPKGEVAEILLEVSYCQGCFFAYILFMFFVVEF